METTYFPARCGDTFKHDGRTWRVHAIAHTRAYFRASTVFDGKPARSETFTCAPGPAK